MNYDLRFTIYDLRFTILELSRRDSLGTILEFIGAWHFRLLLKPQMGWIGMDYGLIIISSRFYQK